jgi:5-hydroxyisourate hydrolase
MSAISTHVLDTARGCPASGLGVTLEQGDSHGAWRAIGEGETDRDGRLRTLMKEGTSLVPGPYRLTFDTRRYFESNGLPVFYPSITVTFQTADADERYHVPLLMSPFGYTTYRGS